MEDIEACMSIPAPCFMFLGILIGIDLYHICDKCNIAHVCLRLFVLWIYCSYLLYTYSFLLVTEDISCMTHHGKFPGYVMKGGYLLLLCTCVFLTCILCRDLYEKFTKMNKKGIIM